MSNANEERLLGRQAAMLRSGGVHTRGTRVVVDRDGTVRFVRLSGGPSAFPPRRFSSMAAAVDALLRQGFAEDGQGRWGVRVHRGGPGEGGVGALDDDLGSLTAILMGARKAACTPQGRAAAEWSCGGEGVFSKGGRRLLSGAVAPPIAMACQVGGQKAVKGLLDKVCGASDERAQAAVDQVMQHGQKKEIPMGSLSAAFHGVAASIGADVSTPTYPGSTVTNLTAPSIELLNALRAAGSKGWALSTFFRKATEYGFDAGEAHRFIQVAVSRGLVSQAVRGRISAR